MTPQEAYNKGLTDAETLTVSTLNNCLDGNDSIPFLNPEMEAVRQRILNYKPQEKDYNFILDYLHDRELGDLSDVDKTIIKILQFCEEIVGPKPRSRVSVRAKEFLTELKVDLIQTRDKFN